MQPRRVKALDREGRVWSAERAMQPRHFKAWQDKSAG